MSRLVPLLILCLTFSLSARSETVLNEVDFLVGRNLILGSSRFEDAADSGFGLNANFRHMLSDNWSVGLGYHYIDFTDVETKDHALYVISSYEMEYEGYLPFITGGLGVAKVSDTVSYSAIAFHGAIGVRKHWKDNIKFHASLQLHHVPEDDDRDNSQTIISPMVGVTFSLYKKENMVSVAPVDLTMDTIDTDKDGVIDNDDQCPGTPQGTPVNYLGCKKDEDVNISLNVKFELGSSILDQGYVDDLQKLAAIMKKNPTLRIEVQGHTDNSGDEQFNIALSLERASSVTNYLVQNLGISSSRVKAKGYGPRVPIADNSTFQGRKKNRRVEAKLMIE